MAQQHPSPFGIRPSEASAASGELPSSDRPAVTAATLFAGSEGGMGSGASRPHHSTVILPLPASGHHWGGRAPRLPLFDNAFGRADTAVGVPRSPAAPLWRAHLPPAVGGAPPPPRLCCCPRRSRRVLPRPPRERSLSSPGSCSCRSIRMGKSLPPFDWSRAGHSTRRI